MEFVHNMTIFHIHSIHISRFIIHVCVCILYKICICKLTIAAIVSNSGGVRVETHTIETPLDSTHSASINTR